MKKILSMGLLMITSLFASAQKPVHVKIWEGEGSVVNENPIIKQWVNGDEYTEATLTIYPAAKPNGQAIVACPGGGYAGIAVTHEGHDMAAWFNTQGITYAVLHYRMPYGKHEIPLSDVHQSIRYLRKNANQWGIKTLGVMGFSAGGHLASTAATHFTTDTRPDFQILFYPVVTMGENTHQGSKDNLLGKNPSEELVRLYSNELQVNAQTPQAFILHSSDDNGVPVSNSVNYYTNLVKHGVPVTMHLYPIGGHGWGYNENFPYKSQWKDELEKWLREIRK
ncbi:MAG: alpha/beta hydrolase [Bacteroidaceae bacterium]|nr:alpha/beta hydrolase [Bacteroidaceae bacterium]